MQVSVKNQNGDPLDSIGLNDVVFDVPMNPSLVHQAMVIYQGNKRHGTHDTKTRAQVSGGGRKPWTQKHTGRARQGSIRSPQWRHGGVVFGPHPRSYRAALPKRMKRQALRCMLSEKTRGDRLFCVDSTSTIDGKTKSMTQLLANLSITSSALFVTLGTDRDVVLAANNIPKIRTLPISQLNAQELLSRDWVIMTVEAARWIEETLSSEPHGRRGLKVTGRIAVADAPVATETAVADPVVEESAAEEETPKPRRRRAAAATTEAAATDAPSGEETPKPRARRRRTTANAAEETTPEASTSDSTEETTLEEEA